MYLRSMMVSETKGEAAVDLVPSESSTLSALHDDADSNGLTTQDEQDITPQQTATTPTTTPSTTTSNTRWITPTTILRSLVLDIPLATIFFLFLMLYSVREIHNHYYVPLMDRASRTDFQLQDEFTYYERQCTEYDLSTRNIQDLLVVNDDDNTNTTNTATAASAAATTATATHQMMTHGAAVIPSILSLQTVAELRAYVVRRNAAVTDQEAYPVSQGTHRLSYGIDATEDAAVSRAIQQVASHPLTKRLLQELLGDEDPASAEITAITAYAGCKDQNWHQDTKADGNAIKFARTYSHSYSLFLPLQDTTRAMGPTDICPGTHYCTNDLEHMCASNAMGLNEATPDQIFRAGDGALLNQHVWHRGTAHSDPEASERIVFILSFLARPSFGKDPRQLSRGTYFHQKWNMWGHTWKDLLDPMASMQQPFSTLRCLSLWKPSGYNWGYDLVTSGFMRFVNNQLEDEDLPDRFLPRLDQIRFPTWLRGRYLDEEDQSVAWRIFISETIDKTYAFVKQVALWTHAGYFALVLVVSVFSALFYGTGTRVLRASSIRFLLIHGLLLGMAFTTLRSVRTSDWGSNVLKGRTLMRPFPPVAIPREEAVMVSTGPTTLPQRTDVLFGTRFDAAFLGSYDRWLDYHPGNTVFRRAVSEVAPLYPAYQSLQPAFAQQLVQQVVDSVVQAEGRFLQQDYRTGDWRLMSQQEALETVRTTLVVASSGTMALVVKSIDHQIADYRFGELRGTALARASLLNLWLLKNRLLASPQPRKKTASKASSTRSAATTLRLRPREASLELLPRQPAIRPVAAHLRFSMPPSAPTDSDIDSDYTLAVGSLIECIFDGDPTWFPGVILRAHTDDDDDEDDGEYFDVSFHDDTFETHVEASRLRKHRPVQQDDMVQACYGLYDDDDCYSAQVLRVMPNADVMLLFPDGGEWDHRVPSTQYFVER